MQREPIIDLGQGLLDDPCHFVRRACQLADYGDPAQERPARRRSRRARRCDGYFARGRGGRSSFFVMTAELAPRLQSTFAGDGEMARRIRELDWASTPLGPVGEWPQALRTSVSILPRLRVPDRTVVGRRARDPVQRRVRALLGSAKHPRALGRPGSRVWAEIWDIIGPMLAQVLEQGKATRSRDLELHLNREGYLEETYFSFSYSPIYDETRRGRRRVLPVHRDHREGHRRTTARHAAGSGGTVQRRGDRAVPPTRPRPARWARTRATCRSR